MSSPSVSIKTTNTLSFPFRQEINISLSIWCTSIHTESATTWTSRPSISPFSHLRLCSHCSCTEVVYWDGTCAKSGKLAPFSMHGDFYKSQPFHPPVSALGFALFFNSWSGYLHRCDQYQDLTDVQDTQSMNTFVSSLCTCPLTCVCFLAEFRKKITCPWLEVALSWHNNFWRVMSYP